MYQAYLKIIDPEFFTEDSTPDRAALWLARDEFLNVMVDLCRDLLWHNMYNRWKNTIAAQEVLYG